MAKNKLTVFQTLERALKGNWNSDQGATHINSYDMSGANSVLYKTTDKDDYEKTKLELQQNRYLRDRWVKANVDLSVSAFSNLSNVKLMYRDADLMDSFPEIGAALDTVSEESCIFGDTKIKLLNGDVKTVKELFDENASNFWVYSVDANGECKPSMVERVIYKGVKPLYKITLDDDTVIKCTGDHKWMISDCSWKNTEDLVTGDSLMSIYDKLDYKGYERIKSTAEKKFNSTHRIVAENVLRADKEKLIKVNNPHQLIVIHHKSFNKLNNDPGALEYMFWDEHQKLHNSLNSERWNNDDFSKKMRKIFSETAKMEWKEHREKYVEGCKRKWARIKETWTKEQLCESYGRKGEQNGMHGIHRFGKENPNYNKNKGHIEDINEKEYLDYLINVSYFRKDIAEHFNLTMQSVILFNRYLCSKYNCKCIKGVRSKFSGNKRKISAVYQSAKKIKSKKKYQNPQIINIYDCIDYLCKCGKKSGFLELIQKKCGVSYKKARKISGIICSLYGIKDIRQLRYVASKDFNITNIKNIIKGNNNIERDEICKMLGISTHDIIALSKLNGYKHYKDLRDSVYNHRVKSIEKLNEDGAVYDLLNSSTNHCFGVKCNDGQIISHNCLVSSNSGQIVNVYSKSDRIKAILEDLFVNRLNLQVTAPMIIRQMCKYGNQFMLLDIDNKLGVKDWKQLPVFNVERLENGIQNPYGSNGWSLAVNNGATDDKDLSTKFVWYDENNSQVPFRNWQIAHFRLLTNSMCLPYGCSYLNSARRHWRLLSLMEDMMLIYRLERSIERRVYKIYVGAIDDADVQAYVENIANNFKRTPIIDPMTGQIDLRKNILDVSQDLFIPVRDSSAPTPIDTLPAAQNLTAIDDIKYIQNKVLTALRIPKSFLNFEENAGDGKNLALMDIRFTRVINRIQQAFLMELTKVASIHLYLLGFEDDLTNFNLTMNNPSTQAEQLEIDNVQKKITAFRDAVSDPGNGLPAMSYTRASKEILKWSDKEIKDNLEEIRLERAISAELEKTVQIIKRTGIFDTVDRVYGEPGAEYQEDMQQGGTDDGMGGGMPGGGGGFGGGLDDLGAPGMEDEGDLTGEEGAEPTTDMGGGADMNIDNAPEGGTNETHRSKKPLLTESVLNKELKRSKSHTDELFEKYVSRLNIDEERKRKSDVNIVERTKIYDKSLLINEEFNKMIESLNELDNDKEEAVE